jgi:hypothetical protein
LKIAETLDFTGFSGIFGHFVTFFSIIYLNLNYIYKYKKKSGFLTEFWCAQNFADFSCPFMREERIKAARLTTSSSFYIWVYYFRNVGANKQMKGDLYA